MYTKKQIDTIQNNKNVIRCSDTSIVYTKKFKLSAIQLYLKKGYSPNTIFKEAKFDLNIIGKDKPKGCLARWRRTYKEKGKEGLINDGRSTSNRKKKLEFKTADEEIKYLKAKIAYMDAENDFLAKLRGLKRE